MGNFKKASYYLMGRHILNFEFTGPLPVCAFNRIHLCLCPEILPRFGQSAADDLDPLVAFFRRPFFVLACIAYCRKH